MKKILTGFLLIFLYFVRGQGIRADDPEFHPFRDSGDFLYSHYHTEIQLDYAVRLTKLLDSYLSSVIAQVSRSRAQMTEAITRYEAAVVDWESFTKEIEGSGIKTEADLAHFRTKLLVLQISSRELNRLIENHQKLLNDMSEYGIRLADPFSAVEYERLRVGAPGDQWRQMHLLWALDVIRAHFLKNMPEVYTGAVIPVPVIVQFVSSVLSEASIHLEKLGQVKYTFEKSSADYFEVLKNATEILKTQYLEAGKQRGLAQIFDGTFVQEERSTLEALKAGVESVNELTRNVSEKITAQVFELIQTSKFIREKFENALPKTPSDPWNITRAEMDQFTTSYKSTLRMARVLMASGLMVGDDFIKAESELTSEWSNWNDFKTKNNERWENDQSEYALALKNRLDTIDKRWEWQVFRRQLVLDFAEGFLALSRFVVEAAQKGDLEEAAVAFMSIKGTLGLVRELPEEAHVKQIDRYITRADKFIKEWGPKLKQLLTPEIIEETEYVFGPMVEES